MTPPEESAREAPAGQTAPKKRVGPFAVARILLAGLFMIGRKGTWEKDGPGAQLTPAQIVIGALTGTALLVLLLVLLASTVIRLATA